jgi:hypothetical protein
MIDQVDQTLIRWVQSILAGSQVLMTPPQASESGEGVGLFLMDAILTPPPRGAKRPPLQIGLRYLVTTWAESPEQAHRMFGDLLFAALESNEFEVESGPRDVWIAFGVAPRPSFVLRVPLRRERPERIAPLVRAPLVIKSSPLQRLSGIVVGPEEIPIMNARVDLPTLQLSTETDSEGRFEFSAVPGEKQGKLLRVRARGREFSLTTEQAEDDRPLVIRLQLTEE